MATDPSNVTLALVQTRCEESREANVEKAVARIGEAAAAGANVVCLPELFAGPYPCQSEDHRRFDEAMDQARKAEARYATGRARPLEGLPLAVKDEQEIKGQPSTSGSLLYRDTIAQSTSPSIARLLRAGAIVHARTVTPEFCCVAVTHSRLWGVSRNPWNRDYDVGGSSGGSAAAVARAEYLLTNDTGLMHMATALDRKVIAVFGPTVKEFGFFPFPDKAEVVENLDVRCRPCSYHGTDWCPKKHFRCMEEIKPEQVFQIAARMLTN